MPVANTSYRNQTTVHYCEGHHTARSYNHQVGVPVYQLKISYFKGKLPSHSGIDVLNPASGTLTTEKPGVLLHSALVYQSSLNPFKLVCLTSALPLCLFFPGGLDFLLMQQE